MKKSSEENMIKRKRKLCVMTLMTKKRSFLKKEDNKSKTEKCDNLDDNKKRNN